MKQTKKILACVVAAFAMVLVACGQTTTSSSTSVAPSSSQSVSTSVAPSSSKSVASSSSMSVAPSSSKSSAPAIHVCHHTCPKCGGCTDPECQDPICLDKCTCTQPTKLTLEFDSNGVYRFEAENYSALEGDVAITDVASASNGKVVENIAYGDSLIFSITADKAYENVKLGAKYGLGINASDNGAVEIYVNGTKDANRVHGEGWTPATHPANDNIGMSVTGWACDAYGKSNPFNLVKGDNTIKICCPFGSNPNYDYFEIIQSGATEPHTCQHVCPVCGGCKDATCEDPACATKCTCPPVVDNPVDVDWDSNNQILLEAEDGKIEGVMTGTDPGDQFVGERTSDNPDHATSGGKVVFCWAKAGNTVTWKINMPAAEERAQLTLWATCAFDQSSSGLGISVNGSAKSWKEGTVHGQGNQNKWYYWNEIHTEADLNEGENTIVITNLSGESWNLDCLVISKYVTPEFDTFTDGKLRVEAENGVLSGGAEIMTQGDGETLSGGRGVGNFNGGAVVTLTVKLEKATKVTADICYALGQCNNENQAVELHVNGTKINGEIDNIGTNVAGGWHEWEIGSSRLFELNAGDNTIELKVPYGSAGNLDYIEFIEIKNALTKTARDVKVEAENFETSSGVTVETDDPNASGGKYVGHFDHNTFVTYSVYVEEETTAYIDFVGCLGQVDNGNDNRAYELYVDGGKIGNFGPVVAESGWCVWTSYVSTEFTLTAGMHEIKFAGPYESHSNIDYFKICKPAPLYDTFVEGKMRLETEYGELSGGAAVFDQNDTEILSNGQGVGDFNGSAAVTLTINLEEAATVTADIRYALGLCNNENQAVELFVNGTKIKGEIDNIGTNEVTGWHTWTVGSSKVFTLNAGENTIELKAPYGSYTNLDYIELVLVKNYLTKNATEIKVEAEDFESGSPVNIETDSPEASGGKYVGGFDQPDQLSYKITVEEATTAYLDLVGCLGQVDNNNDNRAYELYIDDANIGNFGPVLAESGWCVWTSYKSAPFTLTAGEHTITLGAPYQSHTNLDYFKVVKVSDKAKVLTFTDDKAIFECEDGIVTGGEIGNNDAASGGKLVGDWGDGHFVDFVIFVKDTVSVKASMMACCWSDPGSNGVAEFYLDGSRIDGAEDHMTVGLVGANIYHQYSMTASTKAMTLTPGYHTIRLAHPWSVGANLDYLQLAKVVG